MVNHSPESGYPRANMSNGESFDDGSTFTFDDGKTVTGAHLNELMRHYLESTIRGQQLREHLQGEGPAPEPLFSVLGGDEGRVLLGTSEVDVTGIEPLTEYLLDLIQRPEAQ